MTSAQDDWEFISFLDAQTNPALLNPIDDQLSDAMSSQLELEKEEQDGTTTNGHAREVEVIYGKQREEEVILIAQAEGSIISNGRKKKHLDPAIEARDREREREKEARRLQREEIEKKAIILKAIQNNSTIEKQKARLEREAKLCSDWTAGRSGAEAIGRQINGLWQSSRPTDREVAQRDALITDAEECINKKWPGCGLRLIPFGSTRTGLIEPRSDIDLTLFDPLRPFGVGTPKSELEKPLEGASNGFLLDSISMYGVSQLPDYYSVNLIANALRRHGKDARGRDKFIKVVPISKARVPIGESLFYFTIAQAYTMLCSQICVFHYWPVKRHQRQRWLWKRQLRDDSCLLRSRSRAHSAIAIRHQKVGIKKRHQRSSWQVGTVQSQFIYYLLDVSLLQSAFR
jgi:hypothetical protein